MHILMLTSSYPSPDKPYRGVFVRQWAEFLRDRHHRVTVVTPRQPGTALCDAEEGLTVHRFEYRGWRDNPTLATLTSVPILMTLSYLCGMLRTARRILRTEAIDLIHSAWVIPSGFAGVVLKRRYRKPLVIVAHGSDLNVWKDRLLPGLFIRNVLRRADHLITIGHSLKERARECGMPEERISPILCGSGGINLADYAGEPSDHALRDRLGVAPHHLVGLVVARIQPPKRFDLMIDAALRVRAQYPDFTLLIVGGESHECARLVPMPASWQDAVMFAGAQPQERVKDFLHIADLFVYASDHEGIPSGILEALAAGLPVVASRVGGIPEIIRDGHTGFLVPNDAGVFADRMLHLCRHPDLRAEMGRAARRFAEEMLSHERLIPRIETIYAGAIRQTAR